MRKKINIILIILAYMLNFGHDILPHEHFALELVSYLNSHNHSEQSEKHHHDDYGHEDRENDESLPFSHTHLNQSNYFIQIRNTQNPAQHIDYSESPESYFLFNPHIEPKQIFSLNDRNIYYSKISPTIGLRAPPVIS